MIQRDTETLISGRRTLLDTPDSYDALAGIDYLLAVVVLKLDIPLFLLQI